MDNDETRTWLILAVAFVGLVMLAGEHYGPPPDFEGNVETATLPPLPATALPDGSPQQTDIRSVAVELGDGYSAELLYGYVLEGLVVTRREFRNDTVSGISPLDLGITWGDLSEPARAASVSFNTVPRGVTFRPVAGGAALPADWETQITNNHLIPANPAVHDALQQIEVGQTVRISGYLVVVTGDGISPWRSSTRRDDHSIYGGCEIILVRDVEILPARGESA